MSPEAPTHGSESATALPLERRIERQCYALGFDLVGFVRLGPVESATHFEEWLSRGHAGEMRYMAHDPQLRGDTTLPHPGAVSAVVVGMQYGGREPSGPVARYARGDDYHDVLMERLRALHRWLVLEVRCEVPGRSYVDTAPILERDLARRAGLGWFGKNTNLINPALGSFFFIGSLFVALELQASAPFEADRCGSCTRCLDACPTDAFDDVRVLDARKCISYLTIEQRGVIPQALRSLMGELIYGCDICQEVCPWNERFSRALPEGSTFAARGTMGTDARTLAIELLSMDAAAYARAFRGSAMKRAKLRGLQRNAAVALGNRVDGAVEPALLAALSSDEALVRGHAAWALGRTGSASARAPLLARAEVESDPWALGELRSALLALGDPTSPGSRS